MTGPASAGPPISRSEGRRSCWRASAGHQALAEVYRLPDSRRTGCDWPERL